MYIPWIHKCVIKTVGSGTSYKYTTVQIDNVKYYILLNNSNVNHLYT